jgi:hypothetical protein
MYSLDKDLSPRNSAGIDHLSKIKPKCKDFSTSHLWITFPSGICRKNQGVLSILAKAVWEVKEITRALFLGIISRQKSVFERKKCVVQKRFSDVGNDLVYEI